MKKFAVSIVAICAMMIFVACGGNSTKTPDNEKPDSGDTGTENDNEPADTGDTTSDTGDEEPAADTGNEDPADTGDNDPADTGSQEPDGDNEPADTGDTEPDTGDSEPQECELSELEQEFVGTWAQKIILRSKSSTTLAKNVPSVTTRYIVTEIKPDANCKLDFNKKANQICRTDNRTGDSSLNQGVVKFNEPDSKFNTIFFHWKPADIAGQENVPYLEIAEEGGEKTFKLNKDWELRGANMENPAAEEMISDKNDSRIFDHDGDGKAAFTIKFNGFVSGPMYYVQRLSHILTGKVVADGKIEGNVEWTDEQFAHPDTPNMTLKGQKTTVTDTSKSVFQLVKVDDSMNCETLLEQADTIFDIEDPNLSEVPHNSYE
ncbi:hypothetical protein J6Z39_10015 [bacterium]|nr:hypothetical protein [bacterium]